MCLRWPGSPAPLTLAALARNDPQPASAALSATPATNAAAGLVLT